MIMNRTLQWDQRPLHALVVEDDMLILLDIEEILKSIGVTQVSCATSVDSAMALLEQSRPDFALMDYKLRQRTAADLAKTLQDLGVPFAFVTASAVPPEVLPIFASPPVVMKPFSEVDIHNTVEQLIQPKVG